MLSENIRTHLGVCARAGLRVLDRSSVGGPSSRPPRARKWRRADAATSPTNRHKRKSTTKNPPMSILSQKKQDVCMACAPEHALAGRCGPIYSTFLNMDSRPNLLHTGGVKRRERSSVRHMSIARVCATKLSRQDAEDRWIQTIHVRPI